MIQNPNYANLKDIYIHILLFSSAVAKKSSLSKSKKSLAKPSGSLTHSNQCKPLFFLPSLQNVTQCSIKAYIGKFKISINVSTIKNQKNTQDNIYFSLQILASAQASPNTTYHYPHLGKIKIENCHKLIITCTLI